MYFFYCHTRSQLGIQLVWILQVLTCKLGPEGLVYVRVHRPAGRPAVHPPGATLVSPTSWPPIKKLLLQKVSNFYKRIQNLFWKQEIELSKQEMELFLLLPDLQSKNFFYKKFLTFQNESKTGFENRK